MSLRFTVAPVVHTVKLFMHPMFLFHSPSFCLHVKNGGMFSWITFVYALWTQSFPNLNPNPLSDCHQARVVKMSKVCTDTEWCLLFEWQNMKVKRFGTAWIFTSYWSLCVSVVTFMVPRNWSLSEIQVEICMMVWKGSLYPLYAEHSQPSGVKDTPFFCTWANSPSQVH